MCPSTCGWYSRHEKQERWTKTSTVLFIISNQLPKSFLKNKNGISHLIWQVYSLLLKPADMKRCLQTGLYCCIFMTFHFSTHNGLRNILSLPAPRKKSHQVIYHKLFEFGVCVCNKRILCLGDKIWNERVRICALST